MNIRSKPKKIPREHLQTPLERARATREAERQRLARFPNTHVRTAMGPDYAPVYYTTTTTGIEMPEPPSLSAVWASATALP
jgi:hypothetical protein